MHWKKPLLFSVLALGLIGCRSCGEENPPEEDMSSSQMMDMTSPQDATMAPDMVDGDQGEADLAPDLDMNPGPDLGPPTYAEADVHALVRGCYSMSAIDPGQQEPLYLAPGEDGSYGFTARNRAFASRFYMQASDLATYLLHDEQENYFVARDNAFIAQAELESDFSRLEDGYLPGAQWRVEISGADAERFQLVHLATGQYLSSQGLVDSEDDAATIAFVEVQDCVAHPELTLDAEGMVTKSTFDDGDLYGIVETHSHLLSNFGFGGGGIFHGSTFHPLGIEHALPDCHPYHGPEGRKDLFGFGFDQGEDLDQMELLLGLVTGRTPRANHATKGYPVFTDWPNAPSSSTHQTQYYLWLQRAYMSGLRLVVQHATTNRVICELITGLDAQEVRYSCDDMTAVDRILEETRNMERYIDAQSGGPGKGWFRIVETPAEAREVIAQGKLAVVLGIETSNLFSCLLVPRAGESRCTEQEVLEKLDAYHEKGVRVLFPVHKYDNGFSAGDGSRAIIELGNFAHTGHWSNFTQDCPDVPSSFDKGRVVFGGINDPRDDYLAPPPNDTMGFAMDPVSTLLDYQDLLMAGPLEGDYCQNAGLTDLGEFLINQLMLRGMVIELDHLPRRSYVRAFEMLTQADYPGVGSHGNNNNGALYDLGGVSKVGFGRCSDPAKPGDRSRRLRERVAQIEAAGGYPAEGIGFDLNGFAGAIGPRFSEESPCGVEQTDPVTYPFTSYAGDVTFTQPVIGERTLDFNSEGLIHVGMLPELIEDLRHDGATDEELEPLFRSAEGYIRMWEKSEERGRALSAQQ